MFPGPGNLAAALAAGRFLPGGQRLAAARLGSQAVSADQSCKFATLAGTPPTGVRRDPPRAPAEGPGAGSRRQERRAFHAG